MKKMTEKLPHIARIFPIDEEFWCYCGLETNNTNSINAICSYIKEKQEEVDWGFVGSVWEVLLTLVSLFNRLIKYISAGTNVNMYVLIRIKRL